MNCQKCPKSYQNNGRNLGCQIFEGEFPKETVEIVEKWSKEHPVKTRQSVFLEQFPNAEMESNGYLYISPCHLDYTLCTSKYAECERAKKYGDCMGCRKAYWSEVVEESGEK